MRPELIEIADDYVLQRCVPMSVSKLSRKSGYRLTFDEEYKMTLKEYKELALSRNEVQNNDCHSAETQFWDHLKKSTQTTKSTSVYAMDNNISRFPEEFQFWNLNKLTAAQSIIHNGHTIPGVNSPYVNYGMKNASFGIHCEDSNMASINFLHEGEPRTWYSVPQSCAEKLENLVQTWVPRTIGCDLFIRHKTVLIPPETLQMHRIDYAKVSL